jgi:hypothetical protein
VAESGASHAVTTWIGPASCSARSTAGPLSASLKLRLSEGKAPTAISGH